MSLRFESCSGGSCPSQAVQSNAEGQEEELFVGRAQHEGSLVPGKLNPSHTSLYISYAGEEIPKEEYEVLVQEGNCDNLHWVDAAEGDVPTSAIQAGHENNGDPLFVARGQVAGGAWSVGKLNPKLGEAHLPYDGTEHTNTQYQVLCFKDVVCIE